MASPAFFLVKLDGSLSLLVDFRWLNKYLRRSPYYVPRIREILMRLASAKCLSTFDANLGYYARRLAKHSRYLIAFCLPFGKFGYKRLPMGICTAPDEYQASMERILGDQDFVVVYLDDILVFSQNEDEHLEHLRIVFERLKKYGVSLNGKKCHVLRKEVEYLGYTFSAEGIPSQKDSGNPENRRSPQPQGAQTLLRHDQLLPRHVPFKQGLADQISPSASHGRVKRNWR
ncbi:Pol Polyprotein [Phytophthora cinnamomi]|uniref:Pol Polyprotein n=1 Tax=Phytophthora cinnamomi TaxID=4785 RepID=UPI00355A01EB|nr:Pol Polyprotein [Phytophthora cinnamomi]